MSDRLIQGMLPLNLPLDVWLAVTSLLLSGGEYFPADIVHPAPSDHAERGASLGARLYHEPTQYRQAPVPRSVLGSFRAQPGGNTEVAVEDEADVAEQCSAVESLTTRERQILSLVSEGCQNKLIAHRMSLSEHTVKAHVHNLIAKLRVSNRTQAAALFLAGAEQPQFAPRLQPALSVAGRYRS
ncbi:LuxR C-terminal-related transcriptional regulator [Devosia algicola]|uniref:LuxR C-terminal-related transcriptional regulator n=1 Tax=Devosia algicola TaxID=3026418 RepID=A0ABY7YNY1_9HYPH|nr:LuxR C-terminal-related transcriptional regulator [Devosia algicola]WDR02971.1 LuxR C-terminal-related transcriptional regulator [Devosia algicola]